MSTNAESDGLKEYEELMSGDITSTPSKTRFVSSNYKRQSVDEAIGEDVDDYTCGGVDFPTFVKLAFNVSEDEYADRVKEIEDWAVHKENTYRAQQDDLVNAPHEVDMYNPIANMGNMVLKRAELEHNIKNKIKLLINHDKVIKGGFAKRKPDLLLVPEHVQQGLSEANTINEEETTAGEGIADEPAPQASRSVHAENGFEIISEENIGASEGSLTEGGFDATTEEDTTTNEDAVTEGGFEVITRKAEEFTTASNHSEGGADATVGKAEGSFASISTAKDDAFETPNTVENEAPNKKGPKDVAIDYRHVLLLFEIKTGKMGTTEKRGSAKGKGKRLSEDDVDDRPSKIRSSTTATGSRERVKLVPDSISLEAKADAKINSTMTSSWARGHTSQDVSKAGPSSTSGYDQKVPGTSTHMRTEGDGHKELVIHSGVGKGVASSSKVCVKTIPTLKELKIQLASYATEVLSIRGDRSFTFGVRMKGSKITLCFYHRSAIIEADEFDVIENPVYFALLLTMFHRDLPLLGFNKDMGYCNPFDFDDKTTITPGATLTTVLGNTLREDKQLDLTQIVMGEKLASAYCLIGRGTSVISAKVEGYKYELAVKFSWQIKSREGEDKYILEARKHDPKHIPEIFGKATIEDNTPIRELRGLCKRIGKVSQYEEREFRILVMRQYTPIYRIDSYDKFWKVITQIAICVHKIYALGKILHRDISITNIAFYEDDEGNIIGILLDFDLASLPHQGHDSRHRTGTAPFMAREVLNAAEKAYTHGVHHELESLLYILVWHGVGYKGYTLPKGTDDTLKEWRKGTWGTILRNKETFIQNRLAADKIFGKIPDRKLAIHCRSIHKLRDAKISEMESEGLEPVWEESKVVMERPVSFAEWIEAASVELDDSDKLAAPSPFCSCPSHALPPASAEMERAWQAIPGEATTNSLMALTQEHLANTGEDDQDDHPIFYLQDMLEIPSSILPRRLQRPISPISSHRSSSETCFSDTSSTLVATNDDVSDSASVTMPSPSFKATALVPESEVEPDAMRAAHIVYQYVIDKTCAEEPEAMLRCIEQAMQMIQDVNKTALRSSLRTITMKSFRKLWNKRSDLWYAIERSVHSGYRSERTCECEARYAAPAALLAAFAGVLFAAGVLRSHDLHVCIDLMRAETDVSHAALVALHALVRAAGDKSCRAKDTAYMEGLRAEMEARMRIQSPQLLWDAEERTMMMAEKRRKSLKVPSKPLRPGKNASYSWILASSYEVR
ncbi:hypothetical protein EW145_g5617 [Phellinidium pouzarii]|uniref:Protein kinase domain-containing protein n=1 Tax=Phellinidium pouzarii TaxID=167371 RepID=A0A4S4L0P3_9AGAM|nr:hypothetical protein EW145_g5617 [Phellinidium pouzarii]